MKQQPWICFSVNHNLWVLLWQRLGYATPALWLVTIFHAVYALDALWMEPAILTTKDIIEEGFGFMLAFGNLAWLPFTYSLQARFLADNPKVKAQDSGCADQDFIHALLLQWL